MKHNNETVSETISIVSEPGALTFVTRKEWQILPETCLGELIHCETELVFYGSDCVFMLLRDMYPNEFLKNTDHRLVRIATDERGKHVFHVMNLSDAEATQLCRNRIALWG